jgi:hypothetical protein
VAWTTFPTLTDGQVWTGAHTIIIRDNFAETAPAKATASGQMFVSTGVNGIAARVPTPAAVSTAETTASTTYTDLTTVGPSATVTTGTQAYVIVTARQANNTATAECYTSFTISGATPTVAASDTFASFFQAPSVNGANRASAAILVTGLTAGSNTFKMQYRVSAGTGTFSARQLAVIPF